MVRPTVDTTLPTVALQPQAAPVDTYVRPAVDQSAGSGLMDIARSLQAFSKPLGDLIAQRDAKAKEDDALRAQRDFVANNSTGYDEAVKRGLIPASASPTYVAAWKKLQGDVAGSQMEQEALAAYEQSPLKNSTDPNAVGQFISEFLKDRMGTTDPEVLRGLMPRVHSIRSAIYNRHLQDQDAKIKTDSQNLLGAQGANALDDAHAQGLATGEPNYSGAFQAMQTSRAALVARGMTEDAANTALFGAVTEKAIANNDPKILDFFNLKVPGQSYTYKDTPDGLKAYNNAVEKLDVISRRNKVEAHQAQTEADRKAKEKTEADALDIISQNPNAPLPDELNKRGKVYDGSWEAKVQTWRTQFINASASSDPRGLAEVQKEIMDDPSNGPQLAIEALNKGVLNASDFRSIYQFAKDNQGNAAEYNRIEGMSQVRDIMGAIKQRTAPTDWDWQAHPNDITNDGLRAMSDYRLQIRQWMAANPEAAKDPIKLGKALDEIGAGILGRISKATTDTGGQYSAPGGGAGNPFGANAPPPAAPPRNALEAVQQGIPKFLGGTGPNPPGVTTAQPPAAPAAPTVAPQATTPQGGPTPQEVDTWLKGQSPIIQQTIEGQAAKSKDPEAFKRGVMEKFQRNMQQLQGGQPQAPSGGTAPDGTPVQKSSFTGATPISAFADETPTPGQALDNMISDPQGALGAIQDAISGQTNQEEAVQQLGEAFDKAYETPSEESYASMGSIPIGQLPANYSLHRDKGNSPVALAYQRAGISYLEKEFGAVGADIIAANLQHESRFDPNALNKNDAGPGLHSNGLAQWNRGRLARMRAFSQNLTGKSYDTLSVPEKFQAQIAFVAHEIKTNPNYMAALERAKLNPSMAGQIFGRVYEGYDTKVPGNDAYRNKNFLAFQRRRRSISEV